MTNTKTIARNTGWYGLENIIAFIVSLVTPIMIARTLGPEKNGYIIYLSYIASVVSGLGSLGIPATTRKYMAEYLGMGDRGTARYIYLRTLLLQMVWQRWPLAVFSIGCCGIPLATTSWFRLLSCSASGLPWSTPSRLRPM
jgi:O-antigen/teichoic acid export membrane protein